MADLQKNVERKRVLIVDDQGSIRSVLKLTLNELGITLVDSAPDGQEAIQHLSNNAYDLVICDWNMPKVSGLDVLRTIRQCPETKTLPFLMVTSTMEANQVKAALAEGVSDYLVKPFQPKVLSMKVMVILTRSTHVPEVMLVDSIQSDDDDQEATS